MRSIYWAHCRFFFLLLYSSELKKHRNIYREKKTIIIIFKICSDSVPKIIHIYIHDFNLLIENLKVCSYASSLSLFLYLIQSDIWLILIDARTHHCSINYLVQLQIFVYELVIKFKEVISMALSFSLLLLLLLNINRFLTYISGFICLSWKICN